MSVEETLHTYNLVTQRSFVILIRIVALKWKENPNQMGLHKGMNEQWESIENSFKKFDCEGHLGPFYGGDAIFYVIYIIYLKKAIYKIQHTI